MDLRLAQTSRSSEVLVPVPADHANLCKLGLHSALLSQVVEMISGSLLIATTKQSDQHNMQNTVVYDLPRTNTQVVTAEAGYSNAANAKTSTIESIPLMTDYIAAAPKVVTLPIFDVPHAARSTFVGRWKDLATIDTVLTPDDVSEDSREERPRQSCVTICAMGGMGKTEIALQYAHTRKSKFEAVFWIIADSKRRLADEFSRIALSSGLLSGPDAGDVVICKNVVLEWLSSTSASWLLIFDNADDPSLLQEYWPISSTGAIIVTSRDPLASSMFFENFEINLQPFSPIDAAVLLYQSIGREPLPDEAEECQMLVDYFGGLPLAISHFGGYMQRSETSFRDFAILCDNASIFHRSEKLPGADISSVFEVALTNLHPDSLKLLQILSFWDPDSISESLFERRHAAHAADAVFGSTAIYCKARRDLLQHSLIGRRRDLKQIFVHRLIQDVVRMRMQNEELANAFRLALNFLERAWPMHLDQFDRQSSFVGEPADLISCVLRMKTLYEDACLQLAMPAKQHLARMLQRVGWYVIARPGTVVFTDHIQDIHPPWELPERILRLVVSVEYLQSRGFLGHQSSCGCPVCTRNFGCEDQLPAFHHGTSQLSHQAQ